MPQAAVLSSETSGIDNKYLKPLFFSSKNFRSSLKMTDSPEL
jgi:hypothetical protein